MAAVLALMALAPWTAECVWGGFAVVDWPFVILFLAPQYGGAAVLIREVARRTGGGWPAIALLAAAFGFVQAGLVDQSLFNPAFLDGTGFAADAASARATWVPGLDFSGQQAFSYVGGHVALSICAPIAIVETLARRPGPWLGKRGLAVIAVGYVLGSLLIFRDVYADEHFFAAPVQVAFTVAVALLLIMAAQRKPKPRTGRAPHPLVVGAVAALPHVAGGLAPGWAGVAIQAAVLTLAVALIVRWSGGFDQRHVLAGWGAGLVVSAAIACLVPTYAPSTPAMALLSDVCTSLVTATLIGVTWWRREHLIASTEQSDPRTV
ncbi:hypothetical protein [Paractinoplanes lichenicola]|uniref:Uncharacterized protein n=1 Tax=Paractinoplanes lichenicola TaxID=2802976 RepID=A0ABS1VZ92_9ACTN|nr:hypothetical protein [Actinoplanes lichenicola]MBL7259764.1 hypothetical protein [Actinoplanes lichenicola]